MYDLRVRQKPPANSRFLILIIQQFETIRTAIMTVFLDRQQHEAADSHGEVDVPVLILGAGGQLAFVPLSN
jgi:hypothetical protein